MGRSACGPEPTRQGGTESPDRGQSWLDCEVCRDEIDEQAKTLKQWVRRKRGNRQLLCSRCEQTGGNPLRRMGANPNSAPSTLKKDTGSLATTEVNLGLRPRTTLTALSWPPLIEHVGWPNREVLLISFEHFPVKAPFRTI